MEEKTVHISGISCGHCVNTIKNEVGEIEGVQTVEGDENTKMMTFKWESPATWDNILETLKEVDYLPD